MAKVTDTGSGRPRQDREFVECKVCDGLYHNLAWTHLQRHWMTTAEYRAHLAHAESLDLGGSEYDLVELEAQH